MSPAASPALPLDPAPPALPRRIAVIGGGISGLAAAHRLLELDPTAQVTLFESSGRLGGVLQTDRGREGWLIERSADMFTTREPWALDLCRRIGIEGELLETDARFRRAFVVRRGKLLPIPEGFTLMSPARVWPILKTPLLSPLGKLRLASEYFTSRPRTDADESLESFVVRHFGREAFDRLIQPLIGGIYTADPSKLSMQATLPQFVELERKFGSLIRGMRAKGTGDKRQETEASGRREPPGNAATATSTSGARYGLFVAPRDGMQRLVEALAARLPAKCIRLSARVERIERRGEGWRLVLRSSEEEFDELIVAAPAAISSRLLQGVQPELAGLVGQINAAGCSVALLGIRRDQLPTVPSGFGFVVPAIEKRPIIAGSLASLKFPGRAPEGRLLLRVFVGGALQPELASLPEDEIRTLVLQQLRELLGLTGEPEFFEVARWLGLMPQYHVGHLDLVAQIEQQAAAIPNFALAGNAYRGVGVPFCIHSGEQAAEALFQKQNVGHVGGTL